MSKWMMFFRSGNKTVFYLIAADSLDVAVELAGYFGERYKVEIIGITPLGLDQEQRSSE